MRKVNDRGVVVAPRDGAREFVIKMREPREGGGQ